MNQDIELVDIAAVFPQVRIDMKYATADNITGRTIYSENRCLLHRTPPRPWGAAWESPSWRGSRC